MNYSKPSIFANAAKAFLVGLVLTGCVETEMVAEYTGLKAINEELPEDLRYGPVTRNLGKIIDGSRWNNYLMGKRDKLYLHDEINKPSNPDIVCYDKDRSSLTRLHNDPLVVKLTHKAERGDVNAQLILGAMYNKKKGVKSRYIAWSWYQCAADSGEAKAQHMVGSMYAEFNGQEAKINEAVKWHTLAAEQDYVESQLALGLLYADIRPDRAASLEWLNKAAENGSEKAKSLLEMNGGPRVSESEIGKAQTAAPEPEPQETPQKELWEEPWDKKEPAKEKAGGERTQELEQKELEQIKQERKAAVEEMARKVAEGERAIKKAAQARAQERAKAQATAIKARNKALAEEKAEKERASAVQENQASESASPEDGQGASPVKDQETNKSKDAQALFQTAYAYDAGKGVVKNIEKAIEHYKLSADKGNAAAQYNLGLIYRMGRSNGGKGGGKDPTKAAQLFNLAAEQGHLGAQSALGEMFYAGEGVAKDFAQSAYWRKAAAERGEPMSQEALSAMYRDGQGVEQNNVQANKWLEIAVSNEGSGSLRKSWLKRQELLTKRMTPEEIAESKRLAGEWVMKEAPKEPAPAPKPPETPGETHPETPGETPPETPGEKSGQKSGEQKPAEKDSQQAAAVAGGYPGEVLDAMIETYVKAVNARDFGKLRMFSAGPEQLNCGNADNKEDYNAYLSTKLSREITPGYKTAVKSLAPDAPIPESSLTEYPIRPTHYMTIELKKAAPEPGSKVIKLGATIVQYLLESGGSWAFVFGCPTEEGLNKLGAAKTGGHPNN